MWSLGRTWGWLIFLWTTLWIPAMEMKKITQLKWESNSLTFEELIFFSAEPLILRTSITTVVVSKMFWMLTLKEIGKMNQIWLRFCLRRIGCNHQESRLYSPKFSSPPQEKWPEKQNASSCRLPFAPPITTSRKLMPLDLLDLQGNEGLVAAAAAPVPDALLSQVQQAMQRKLGWVRLVLVIP